HWRDDERNALFGIDDLDRISPFLGFVIEIFRAVDAHRPFPRCDDTGWIKGRLNDMQFVFRQIAKVVPTVEIHQRQHMSHDYAAIARMGSDQLTAPSGI